MISTLSLVVDESCNPIAVVDWKRAIVLLLTGRAVPILDFTEHPVRSVSFSIARPSIIQMIKTRGWKKRRVPLTRLNVFARDGYVCAYCGIHGSSSKLTLDHVIPSSRGGENSWKNLITACLKCNQKKADRTPDEAGIALMHKPYEPKWGITFIMGRPTGDMDSWKAFLGDPGFLNVRNES